jgi:Pentapeptide repeats (8 copies)
MRSLASRYRALLVVALAVSILQLIGWNRVGGALVLLGNAFARTLGRPLIKALWITWPVLLAIGLAIFLNSLASHDIRWRLSGVDRFGRPLVVTIVLALFLGLAMLCIFVLPSTVVTSASQLGVGDRLKLENDVRATLLQGLGGLIAIVTAVTTWLGTKSRDQELALRVATEEMALSREAQVTQRFAQAVDQLGHESVDVRIGGIYGLERIARDSVVDRTPITEVLASYVRGHAPWPPALVGQYTGEAPAQQLPQLQFRSPDVQAVLTVLGRRSDMAFDSERLDLSNVDLRKAFLPDTRFDHASLRRTHLEGAWLANASLRGADLGDARLDGASLRGANLEGAWLANASLRGADLGDARLDGASLQGADLRNARLEGAQLNKTLLEGARLEGTVLEETNTQGVRTEFTEGHD